MGRMDPNSRTRILRNLAQKPAAEVERLVRRANVQLEFAQAFAAGKPEFADAIKKAEEAFENGPENANGLNAWVAGIEATLAELGKKAKEYTIHCVGHGHIDMNWMWSWPETVATTHDTFASVLSLMEQYPTLTYSQSQASVYEIIENHYPDMFTQIQKRVKEGRWEVAAAHWVEGDKNIACGESIARHLLYTRRYFEEKFGLKPEDVTVDWEPDTFGHANTIPGILKQGGVKYYYSCRTGGGHGHLRHGIERPPIFWWQGPDGSRVLVNRETTWYNSYVNIGENYALPLIPFIQQTGLHNWLNVYGIGNHGGGPTRVEVEWFLESMDYPVYPTVKFGTSQKYFELIEAEILAGVEVPTIAHELNFEFTGCYTSQSAIKRANRFGENYNIEAETLLALSNGSDADKKRLRQSWINVLFSQFHDILPGSGVAATREHAMGLFQEVGATTGSIKRNALKQLVARINTVALLPDTPEGKDEKQLAQEGKANTPFVAGAGAGAGLSGFSHTSGGGRRFFPFVVYNPCSWERSEFVEVHLYDIDIDPGRIVARDETGAQVATMVTYNDSNWASDWGHRRCSLIFPAQNIPALGYKTFLLCEGSATDGSVAKVEVETELKVQSTALDITFDRSESGLASVVSRKSGKELADSLLGFGAWEYVLEQPRGMTSWVVGGEVERQKLRAKSYHLYGAARNEGTNAASSSAAGILVTQDLVVPNSKSKIRVRALVHSLAPRIDFEAEIDWREIGDNEVGIPGLAVTFSTQADKATFEAPFGSVEREGMIDDVPTLRYVHADGVTILQDSKYGFRFEDSELRMRVVRSSYDPDHAPEVGKSVLRYSVYVHETEPTKAELARLGAAWNHKLIVAAATTQSGPLPTVQSYARVETENVVLTSVKLAEDGSGLVLRLNELSGKDIEAVVILSQGLLQGRKRATAVDLLERPSEGKASLSDGKLIVSVKANSVASVLVE